VKVSSSATRPPGSPLAGHVGEIGLVFFGVDGHGSCLPQSRRSTPSNAHHLDGVEFRHEFGVERDTRVIEQWYPAFVAGFVMDHTNSVRSIFQPVVRDPNVAKMSICAATAASRSARLLPATDG
jgi:hypothetical protein